MSWNPALYLRNQSSRLRPALDLLNQAAGAVENPSNIKKVLDLGCGPGNITNYLCQTFPNAHVLGIDSSNEMISSANKSLQSSTFQKRAHFEIGSSELEAMKVNSDPHDVIYSNAALHWSLHHHILLPQLINNRLVKGGIFAMQMPDTRVQPSHLLMETAALHSGNIEKIENVRIPRTDEDPAYYHHCLAGMCASLDMWSTTYVHQLPYQGRTNPTTGGHIMHPVLEFTKATGLMPILDATGGEDSDSGRRYLEEYEKLLYEEYPPVKSGDGHCILLPYKRFFLVAKKLL